MKRIINIYFIKPFVYKQLDQSIDLNVKRIISNVININNDFSFYIYSVRYIPKKNTKIKINQTTTISITYSNLPLLQFNILLFYSLCIEFYFLIFIYTSKQFLPSKITGLFINSETCIYSKFFISSSL